MLCALLTLLKKTHTHRRVGGSQLGNSAERNSLWLETEAVRRSAALDAGRRQLHTPDCDEPLRPEFTPTLRPVDHLEV